MMQLLIITWKIFAISYGLALVTLVTSVGSGVLSMNPEWTEDSGVMLWLVIIVFALVLALIGVVIGCMGTFSWLFNTF